MQSGEHIVWHCNLHRDERARNRLTALTRKGDPEWGDLDGKVWVPNEGAGDDEDEQVDGIERFFDYLAYQF